MKLNLPSSFSSSFPRILTNSMASGAFFSISLLALVSCTGRQPQVIYVQVPAQPQMPAHQQPQQLQQQGAPGSVEPWAQPASIVQVSAQPHQQGVPGAAQPASVSPIQAAPAFKSSVSVYAPSKYPPQANHSAAVSRTRPQPSVTAAQRIEVAGTFHQCAIERFASGWTTLSCPGAKLVVYAGFSSRPSANFLRSTAQDHIGAYYSNIISPIASKFKAWELTARKRKSQPGFMGDETVSDPNGEILRQATFTKARSKATGTVGILCYEDAGIYTKTRCQELTRQLLQEGVPEESHPKRFELPESR